MIGVNVDVKQAVQDIEYVRNLFHNQKKHKLFRTMAELLMNTYYSETFDKEGARRGHSRWAPLSPAYARYKARTGRSTKPLILTGHARASGKVLSETQDTLTYGSDNPYIGYHNDGDGDLPKREVLFLTTRDLTEIGEFLSQTVTTLINMKLRY